MNKEELAPYETDASRIVGRSAGVYNIKNILEIKSAVINNKRIVIRGAGTGLSGGCIPLNGEDVVLDLSKLNYIGQLDLERKTIEVESGVILADLQKYLLPYNLVFPIDISSREVATIGGMIATNSSSSRTPIDYGRVGHWIQWLEIIDGNGNISKKGVTEISDYCGMEGTTGIILRACLKLKNIKKFRSASILEVGSLDEAVSIARNLKRDASISMIEFFDSKTSVWVGFGEGYHMIIEYEDDTGLLKLEDYEKVISKIDVVYLEAIRRDYLRIEDPKILTDRFDRVAQWLDEKEIPFFSHMSNGTINCFFRIDQERYIPELMNIIRKMGGQISGSKGIGLLKKEFMDVGDKNILANIKKRTDPNNKFNMGKLI